MGADVSSPSGATGVGERAAGVERVLRGSLELPYPRDRLFGALLEAAPQAHVAVTRTDEAAGTIVGRLPTTLFMWSPVLTVRLEEAGEGQTRVTYEARGAERRTNSEERILADTRERLSMLLRGAAASIERERVAAG